MNKIFNITLFIFLISCHNKNDIVSIINTNGLDNKPEYIYFINQNEGFAFSNGQDWEDIDYSKIANPNYTPQPNETAYIYKTNDGAKTWNKIDSIENCTFYKSATYLNNSIFIQLIDPKKPLTNTILKYNLLKLKKDSIGVNFETLGSIWSFNNKVYFTSNKSKVGYLNSTDENFSKIDSSILNVEIKNNVINYNDNMYCIDWENEIYSFKSKIKKELIEGIDFDYLTSGYNGLMLIGKDKSIEKEIVLVNYDLINSQSKIYKKISGYDIIRDLNKSGDIITVFIGNINGAFTYYDLLYSLDNGKSWKIQKLKEPNYFQPNTLLGNELLIYGGENKLQKVSLL